MYTNLLGAWLLEKLLDFLAGGAESESDPRRGLAIRLQTNDVLLRTCHGRRAFRD
jgi:hypothetical protein